jgi:hypothetical protein
MVEHYRQQNMLTLCGGGDKKVVRTGCNKALKRESRQVGIILPVKVFIKPMGLFYLETNSFK